MFENHSCGPTVHHFTGCSTAVPVGDWGHRHPHPTAPPQDLSPSQAGPGVLVPGTHPPTPSYIRQKPAEGPGASSPRFCWVSFSSGLTLPGEGKRGRREGEGKRERGRERETERESTQPPRRRSAGTARRISVPVRRVPASGCLPAPPKCLPSAGSRPPSPLPGSLPSS